MLNLAFGKMGLGLNGWNKMSFFKFVKIWLANRIFKRSILNENNGFRILVFI
jgi:hypothetical protein